MFKKLFFILSLYATAMMADSAQTLFEQKCAMCHTVSKTFDRNSVVAPPASRLMMHMNVEFESDEKKIAHIKDFVMNPTEAKAICPSIRRFGLMPSQKDNVTEAELDNIAEWMVTFYKDE